MKTFKQFLEQLDVKTHTPESIANKHKVDVDTIHKQLKMGMKVEKEHTTDSKVAKKIALDHLAELPDYYTRLKKVEKK
jgi:hypothetical protein